jgi:hypothetical protein
MTSSFRDEIADIDGESRRSEVPTLDGAARGRIAELEAGEAEIADDNVEADASARRPG